MKGPPKRFTPVPYAYHQCVDVEIVDVTNLGQGVGRDREWVIMVPYCLPGERVRARIFRNHATYSEADLIDVITPSPGRRAPGCPHFTECGGCQYQHMRLSAQRLLKQRQVAQLFRRIGGIEAPPVMPTLGDEHAYGYRSKLTPHYSASREVIGFMRAGRRQILDIADCPLGRPALRAALPGARRALRERPQSSGRKARGGTLLLRESVQETVITDMKAVAEAEVRGLALRFVAGEFFQTNPTMLERMVDVMRAAISESGVRYLVDAYCGVGLFALTCADLVEKSLGLEISEPAVNLAEANAQRNRITNARFLAGDANSLFQEVAFPPEASALIIDPPRKGCDPGFLAQAAAFKPKVIAYMSCDPATQARDVRILCAAGWNVTSITPIDLFPQTRHIESLAILRADEQAPRADSGDADNTPQP